MKSSTSHSHSSSSKRSSKPGSPQRRTLSSRGGSTQEQPTPFEPRPYLDKLVMKIHIPEDIPGHEDFVPVKTFPDLYKYSGIRSAYEPQRAPPCDGEGTLTTQYKTEAFSTLKPIFRDEIELNNREAVFKRSHKQFIDDVLNDMDGKHTTQMQRQSTHWRTSKSKLGFSASFNVEQNTQTFSNSRVLRIDHGQSETEVKEDYPNYSLDFESTTYSPDPEFAENENTQSRSVPPPSSSHQQSMAYTSFGSSVSVASSNNNNNNTNNNSTKLTLDALNNTRELTINPDLNATNFTHSSKPKSPVPAMLNRGKIGYVPENSSKLIKKLGYRPPSKMALFNALLETTPAPRSPRKTYGTIDFTKSSAL